MAAKEIEFSSIERERATVRINISFTVTGSDFERQAREEQEEREIQAELFKNSSSLSTRTTE